MPKLLLTGAFGYSEEQLQHIADLGYEVVFMQHEQDALPSCASDVECVVCNGLFLHHDIEDFAALRLIQLTSAGLERVPVDEIHRRGIVLHNARGVYNIPMAEWTLLRILEYYKDAARFRESQCRGEWVKNRGLRELSGSRAAIVGAGNIGQTIARRLSAFDVGITGFDIHKNAVPFFSDMDLTENLGRRLPEFDIVILTVPLTPSTCHMLSREELLSLKHKSLLVNIARGGLIDEKALCDVLKMRPDIHAALDVFETEPLPADSPLWHMPNVAVSPHNSFVSDGNGERMFNIIYENLKNYAERR